MNLWKPIALCSIASLTVLVGMNVAAAGGACHNQPNMASALTSLRSARASLDRAEHDKGGWRAKAVQATDTAIHETERGCSFDDKH